MSSHLHIVAISARTPLGLNAKASAAAVRAGIDGIIEHPFMTNNAGDPIPAIIDREINPALFGAERLSALAIPAIDALCAELAQLEKSFDKVPLLIGLPEFRPGWNAKCLAVFKRAIQNQNVGFDWQDTIELFPNGHAAGIIALKRAQDIILSGRSKLCIVGGVDSYFDPDTIDWLDENRRIIGENRRSAFIPGEGAGFLAVVGQELAFRFRNQSPAQIRAIGLAKEDKLINTDTICLGEGLTTAVRDALAPLSMPRDMIDVVYCDVNGERYRSEEWAFTVLKNPHTFKDPAGHELVSTYLGDVSAASAPLFIMLAMRSGQRGYAKGQRHLVWSSSNTGERSAVVFDIGSNVEQGAAL
ncbi:MAG: hypothetical protein JXR76_30470 [Deltaproteobacteria bacterium]|nr:hypothetical protein [Deltaproteobacteria bacterium]